MSQDQQTSDSSAKSAHHSLSNEQEAASVSLQLGDKNLRVDDSHIMPADPASSPGLQPASQARPESKAGTLGNEPLPVSVGLSEDALLADAGRIFEQLRIRLAELDHRENSQQKKIQELEQRDSQFSRWVDQTRQDLTSRETRLMELETEADRRQEHLQKESDQLQQLQKAHQEATLKLQLQKEEQEQRFQETETEIEQLRRSRLEEIDRIQKESEETLVRKREEFEVACQTQLEEIKQQQSQATRRLRLQEDHLERLRAQTERQQNEIKIDTQQATQKFQHLNELYRMRSRQLEQARSLLDIRDAAINREEQIAATTINHQREQLLQEQQQLLEIQQEWKQIQQQRQGEYEARVSQLDFQQQQIELQQQRLLRTREEVIELHQDNLELRLAFDEQAVKFTMETGQSIDEESLKASRENLNQFHQATREQLVNFQTQIGEQEHELSQKRQMLEQYEADSRKWIVEGITRWEEQRRLLEEQRADANQQTTSWNAKLNQLLSERKEAENIIRDLLNRLEQTCELSQPEQACETATDA